MKFLLWGIEAAILSTETPKEGKYEKDNSRLKTA